MSKLKVVLLVLGVFLVAYGVGREWKLKPETRQNHVVHSGEEAVLTRFGQPDVWVAVKKDDSYPLQQLMASGSVERLKQLEAKGDAFSVAVGTRVRVTGQAAERRHIDVLDGPSEGKSGWVAFEYLRLARPSDNY